MRHPERCLCGDPLCWRCFPAANPGPDDPDDTPRVPDAGRRLLDAEGAPAAAWPRVRAALARVLDVPAR